MTQKEFASILGIKQSQYSRYETGERLAPDQVLEKAARHMGLPADELVWAGAGSVRLTGSDGAAVSEQAEAAAELLRLLDDDALEDLYLYLKAKIKSTVRRRKSDLKLAQKALDTLRRKAG